MEMEAISGLTYKDWIGNLLDIEETAEMRMWRSRRKAWFRIILNPWRKERLNAKNYD